VDEVWKCICSAVWYLVVWVTIGLSLDGADYWV